jgi:hypothetical protein
MSKYQVYYKPEELGKDDVFSIVSKRIRMGNESNDFYNSVETEIRVSVGKDGSLHLSDVNGEGMIYLYPDQLGHLKIALEKAMEQKEKVN